jgi:hypothetical protein
MTEHTRPYKRRRQSDQKIPPTGTSQQLPKKQKLNHPTKPPPAFWDNLSEIPLTRNAVQELERRTNEIPRSSRRQSDTQVRRPVAEWKSSHPPTTSYLARCGPPRIQRFARLGGPDLSDLRGVCIYQMLSFRKLTLLM